MTSKVPCSTLERFIYAWTIASRGPSKAAWNLVSRKTLSPNIRFNGVEPARAPPVHLLQRRHGQSLIAPLFSQGPLYAKGAGD